MLLRGSEWIQKRVWVNEWEKVGVSEQQRECLSLWNEMRKRVREKMNILIQKKSLTASSTFVSGFFSKCSLHTQENTVGIFHSFLFIYDFEFRVNLFQ